MSIQKISVFGGVVGIVMAAFSSIASAHVVVRPAEVVTAGYQTFTIGVPNEKDIPTTSIKLVIPKGLQHVTPTQKAGWEITTEKSGSGEDESVTSISWSGGTIGDGFRDEFTFSAQVPENATELQWKAYQAYADGTVVSWDQATADHGHDSENPNTGPFSVTKVVAETEGTKAVKNAEQVAHDAKEAANRALIVGVAGISLGLGGIFLATRKK